MGGQEHAPLHADIYGPPPKGTGPVSPIAHKKPLKDKAMLLSSPASVGTALHSDDKQLSPTDMASPRNPRTRSRDNRARTASVRERPRNPIWYPLAQLAVSTANSCP